MHTPELPFMFAAIDATWPSASAVEAGPWLLREGRGGGKRVSAATAQGEWRDEDLGAAEIAMRLMAQTPLFMIRPGDDALDAALEARGYAIADPVNLWLCAVDKLTDRALPPVTVFHVWEPLEIMRELWETGGIGPARQRVMDRTSRKTGLFARLNDRPAGVGFCAQYSDLAMVHALEILPAHRGKGLGGWMMRAAAFWAAKQDAIWISTLCTTENEAANRLYASLGMEVVGNYHYRIHPEMET